MEVAQKEQKTLRFTEIVSSIRLQTGAAIMEQQRPAAQISTILYLGTLGFRGDNYARHLHQINFDADQQTILADRVLFRGEYGRIRDVVTGRRRIPIFHPQQPRWSGR